MNQQLQIELASILRAMQAAVVEYGPQALDAAVRLKQIDSIQKLVSGLLGLLILLAVAWFFKRQYTPAPRTPENLARISELKERGYARRSWAEDIELGKLTGSVSFSNHPEWVFALFPLSGGIFLGSNLVDVWTWVGVFQPQLALAHDLLLKLTTK